MNYEIVLFDTRPRHTHVWHAVTHDGTTYDVHVFQKNGDTGYTVMVAYAFRVDPPIRRYERDGRIDAVLADAIATYEADNALGAPDMTGRGPTDWEWIPQ